MLSSTEEPASVESVAAASCVLFALLFALIDIHLWHPGAAWPDEISNLLWVQEWREGRALPLTFFKGCFARIAMAWAGAWGQPSMGRLHWPVLAAFPIESLCLYRVAQRQFSTRTASWAVLINALAAFSWLRLRSLLSYSLTPVELLLLLALLPSCKDFWRSFLWGLLTGLFLLEYETWALAVPVLILAFLASEAFSRPRVFGALLGLFIGFSIVAFLSRAELESYLLVRSSQNLGAGVSGSVFLFGSSFKGYWLGASTLPNLGVSHWPVFPPFAWPALTLGIFLSVRKKFWILIWIAIGFIPLISKNSAAEPQRMIIAWPALCIVAGEGFSWIQERRHKSLALLLALAVLGGCLELRAYAASMNEAYNPIYGYSQEMNSALKQLSRISGPFRFITELDNSDAAAERFFIDQAGLRSDPKGEAVAFVPLSYARGLQKRGRIEAFGPASAEGVVLLYFPDEKEALRLEGVDSELGSLWKELPPFQDRLDIQILQQRLLQSRDMDPWVRSAIFEQALGRSLMMGQFPVDLVKRMETQELQSVDGLYWAASKMGPMDPRWSQRLLARAAQINANDSSSAVKVGP
jgi:hypothetical protein